MGMVDRPACRMESRMQWNSCYWAYIIVVVASAFAVLVALARAKKRSSQTARRYAANCAS